jgi:hypothetical protein
MSERQEIMNRVADFMHKNGMGQVYFDSGLSQCKRYRYVIGARPRVLDVSIRVYGPKFLLIEYQTAYRILPNNDRRVFTSEDDLLNFLYYAFVKLDADKAMAIPTK